MTDWKFALIASSVMRTDRNLGTTPKQQRPGEHAPDEPGKDPQHTHTHTPLPVRVMFQVILSDSETGVLESFFQ